MSKTQTKRPYQLRFSGSGKIVSSHTTPEKAFAAGRGKLGGPFFVRDPNGQEYPVRTTAAEADDYIPPVLRAG